MLPASRYVNFHRVLKAMFQFIQISLLIKEELIMDLENLITSRYGISIYTHVTSHNEFIFFSILLFIIITTLVLFLWN